MTKMMKRMLEAVECSGIDMLRCSDMYAMFQGDNALKAIKGAEDQDQLIAANMNRAFSGCGRLRLDCSRWDVGKVSDHMQFNDGAPGVIAPAWDRARTRAIGPRKNVDRHRVAPANLLATPRYVRQARRKGIRPPHAFRCRAGGCARLCGTVEKRA